MSSSLIGQPYQPDEAFEILPASAMRDDAYAIVGSREPDEAQSLIAQQIAFAISVLAGKIVRTGAASGIDDIAMNSTSMGKLELFLPWTSFRKEAIPQGAKVVVYTPTIHKDWADSVHLYHPAPKRLTPAAFCLHARNYGIVERVKAIIALPNELGQGGTGQAIRIGHALRIKVIQINRGTVSDAPRTIAKILQELGFVNPELSTTILNKR